VAQSRAQATVDQRAEVASPIAPSTDRHRRATDIGALINVGAAGGAQLFVVSETSKLRVYVNVPQNYVPSVPPGTKATITVPEHPGKTYIGTSRRRPRPSTRSPARP